MKKILMTLLGTINLLLAFAMVWLLAINIKGSGGYSQSVVAGIRPISILEKFIEYSMTFFILMPFITAAYFLLRSTFKKQNLQKWRIAFVSNAIAVLVFFAVGLLNYLKILNISFLTVAFAPIAILAVINCVIILWVSGVSGKNIATETKVR